MADSGSSKLTRSRLVSGLLVVALAGATTIACVYASQARTPAQQAAATAAPEDSIVTVPVEAGELVDSMNVTSVLDRRGGVAVPAPASAEGASITLASKIPVAVGDAVENGTLLLEVSGRPMIALLGSVSAYRDLVEGDEGPDVEQLQEALAHIYGTPVTGAFDSRTADDVQELYEDLSYEAITSTEAPSDASEGDAAGLEHTGSEPIPTGQERVRIPVGELVFLPTLPMQVGKIAAEQGSAVTGSVMHLVSGDWKLEAELGPEEVAEFAALDREAELEFGTGPLEGLSPEKPTLETREVETESEPASGSETGSTEKTFAVFTVDGDDLDDVAALVSGTEQVVTLVRARSSENALIVPLSAVWTDLHGQTMLTVRQGERAERQVAVDVTISHEGRGAVSASKDDDLNIGDEIVVAWRDRGGS